MSRVCVAGLWILCGTVGSLSAGCDDTSYSRTGTIVAEDDRPDQDPDLAPEREPPPITPDTEPVEPPTETEVDPGDPIEPEESDPPVEDPGDDPGDRSCESMDAATIVCGPLCNLPARWAWAGDACRPIEACACQGEDCDRTHDSREACLEAHGDCDPELCRQDEGRWLDVPPHPVCGHHICGRPAPMSCFTPVPGCNCGPGRTFAPGVGCLEDDSCTRDDLCLATGGQTALCDTFCGFETGEVCEGGGCDCGLGRHFDEAEGCVERCPDRQQDTCVATGGAWEGNCGEFFCGQPSDDDCDGVACNCGRHANHVPSRGCVDDGACLMRFEGEPCGVRGAVSDCVDHTRCCDTPRGTTCLVPCCGDGCEPSTGCPTFDE